MEGTVSPEADGGGGPMSKMRTTLLSPFYQNIHERRTVGRDTGRLSCRDRGWRQRASTQSRSLRKGQLT